MVLLLTLLKIAFVFISTVCFLKSALLNFPTPPKEGDIISAGYQQVMTRSLKKTSLFNFFGCFFIFLSLIIEILTLFIDIKST